VALSESPEQLTAPSSWARILGSADEAVCSDPWAGFTTLLGFCIAGGHLLGASCGDSAVLVVTAGDQPREVTASQPKYPAVGSGEARFAPFGATLVAPWAVLACSDGVWKYAGWERLVEALRVERGQQLAGRIQGYARVSGGGEFADDFTIVLFEEAAETGVPAADPRAGR
jgi:hypothetical protein